MTANVRPSVSPMVQRLGVQLPWLIAARLLLVTSVAATILLIDALGGSGGDPLAASRGTVLVGLGACYIASLAYALIFRWNLLRRIQQAYVQFFADTILISVLVGLSGGQRSYFSTLYLVVITLATTLLRRRAGFHLAAVCWLAYGVVNVGTIWQWSLQPTALPEAELQRLVYVLTVHFLGFFGVAFMTSFLARDIAAIERELEAKSEDLAQLESLHQDVVQSISSGIVTTDLGGVIHQVNRAGCEILATRLEDLVGRQVFETGLVEADEWPSEQGLADHRKIRREVELSRSGRPCWIGYTLAELRDGAEELRGYTIIFQDFTQWRQLQDELRLRERMAAVGQLAAGLAHEIGNPLAAISGVVQMMASWPEIKPTQKAMLQITQRESERLDRTLKNFLAFARPRPLKSQQFDLFRTLREHLSLLQRSEEVRTGHVLELLCPRSGGLVVGDSDQVSQIVWNLSRNALRAMSDGGRLTLDATVSRESYTICLRDSGRGMSEEERTRLFQPFQSFFDGGTGIGMAIVYRLVTDQGGSITVDSAPQRGTAITVVLPNRATELREDSSRRFESGV